MYIGQKTKKNKTKERTLGNRDREDRKETIGGEGVLKVLVTWIFIL